MFILIHYSMGAEKLRCIGNGHNALVTDYRHIIKHSHRRRLRTGIGISE